MIEGLSDVRNFWIPLTVLTLCGYAIWSYGQLRRRTTVKYITLYGIPMDQMRMIALPIPRKDGSEHDAQYTAFFWNEMQILGIKWALIAIAIYVLTRLA